MALTKDGYTLVDADTTALLAETDKATFYRLCTAYTYRDFVLRFEVSGKDGEYFGTFKTEAEAREVFDWVSV